MREDDEVSLSFAEAQKRLYTHAKLTKSGGRVVQKFGYRLLKLQIFALTVAVLACWCMGFEQARSAVLGGLTFLIPNFYFTIRFFKDRFLQPDVLVGRMVASEVIKLVMMAVLVILALTRLHVEALPYVIGLLACQSGAWFLFFLNPELAR